MVGSQNSVPNTQYSSALHSTTHPAALPAPGDPLPREPTIRPFEFDDFDRLVHRHVVEDLGCPAGRPRDHQGADPVRLAQTDCLLQGVGTEAAAAGDVAVNHLRGGP